MVRPHALLLTVVFIICSATGCTTILAPGTAGDTTVDAVAAKATEIANLVGGTNGFGGPLMDGYLGHMPMHMGFDSRDDLATSNGFVRLEMHNESTQDCTFDLSYIASPLGLTNQHMNFDVLAGEVGQVDLPCAEIVGLGPLDMPGGTGCVLADGTPVANTLAVPGFLGQDFACGGTYQCYLTPDTDDLDGDGDTTELILLSAAMQFHMMMGGPIGHHHGAGMGMMGPHFVSP